MLEWNCSPYRVNSSLHPAIECLEQLLEFDPATSAAERLDRLRHHLQPLGLADAEQIGLFASLLSIPVDGGYAPPALSPQRLKERTRDLLLDWLRELSSAEPVLFIVEDLHWIDASSLELLEMMVDAVASEPILTLLTFRPEFEPPWSSKTHQTQVALNRLTRRQVGEMIRARSSGDVPPDALVDRIAERTDGVPLFVEEFAKIAQESQQDHDEIPVSLQDLLLARLDRLQSDLRVIQLAAVLGREFPYEQLDAVSELDEPVLREELSKLVAAEILFQKGRLPRCRFLFKHALLQDAAYQSLLRKPRQEFHRRIAETLESRFADLAASEPEILAQHFTEAGETTKAIEYWLAAGQKSQGRSANQEAIEQYRAGLAVIETLDASSERDQTENGFRLSLVTAIMAARGYAAPDVQPELQRARELSERIGVPTQLLHVLWFIWAVQLIRAELDVAVGTVEEMLQLSESADDDGLRMEASFGPSCTYFFRGEFDRVPPAARRGLAFYDEDRCRAHAQFTGQNSGVTIRNFLACSLWQLGFPQQGIDTALEAVRLSKQLEHPFSQVHGITEAAWVHYFCRFGEETQRLGEEALAISARHDFPFWEACAGVTVGGGLILQDRPEEGIERVRRALELFRSTGGRVHECFIYAVLVEGLLRSEQYDDALRQIDEALDAGTETGERYMHAELLRLRGEILLLQDAGNEEAAESCYHTALATARQQSSRSWELRVAMSLAHLWQGQGRTLEARELLMPVYSSFSEGFETPDLVHAGDLLRDVSPGSSSS